MVDGCVKKKYVSVTNNVLPSKEVCVKKESVDSNILRSMLFKVLRRVCVILLNLG